MKSFRFKLVVSTVLVLMMSCNEPRTVVTNYVYPDGSVRRRIEMRSSENKFRPYDIQVPFDSTWRVWDSIETGVKGDTTWIRRAEKLFSGVDEINVQYKADTGVNKSVVRNASFRKKFKWFSTEYNFSEMIGKIMKSGYPVSKFMNEEELKWFYSPDDITNEKTDGPDSLRYRQFKDSVDKRVEDWMIASVSAEWIHEFISLAREKTDDTLLINSFISREADLAALIRKSGDNFDSLWTNGIIPGEVIGEANARRFKTEIDSAANISLDRLFPTFSDYRIRTIMPGKLISTNGFVDSAGVILWPVAADYFLTEPYEMTAVSRTMNLWAWIVSGIFILFVISGLIRKGKG